jgi:hypothetical protein
LLHTEAASSKDSATSRERNIAVSLLTRVCFVLCSAVVSIAIGVALTTILANYLQLQNTEILIGDCPCCEKPIKQLFAGKEKPVSIDQKCGVCGTIATMDRTTRKISLASGPDFVSA